MDVYIFYGLVIALLINLVIREHRSQMAGSSEPEAAAGRGWQRSILMVLMGVVAIGLVDLFVGPWLERRGPGPNTAWILSGGVVTAVFAGGHYLIRRLTRQNG